MLLLLLLVVPAPAAARSSAARPAPRSSRLPRGMAERRAHLVASGLSRAMPITPPMACVMHFIHSHSSSSDSALR